MRARYWYLFLSVACFTISINAASLVFVNKSDNPLYVQLEGWRRWAWLRYAQEVPRLVNPEKSLKWSPDIKRDIKQNVLKIYDQNKKLVDKIELEKYKGVTVMPGYERTIAYQRKDLYQDSKEKTGRTFPKFFRIGADILEKTREIALDIFYAAFAPLRKIVRGVKDLLNPAPYNIITKNPFAKTEATVRKGGPIACEGEKKVFYARQKKVKLAQEKSLGVTFKKDEKPLVVAVVASGGGQRARLCTTGSTIGLEKSGLLDCVTYFSSLSGSTWFLAPWLISGLPLRKYRKRALDDAKINLGLKDAIVDSKHTWDVFWAKFAFAQSINLVDLYGALLGIDYLKGFGEDANPQRTYLSSLADEQEMEEGDSVIPIFTAVTAEIGMGHIWCWMTPWEFGSRWFAKTGVYIPIWAFGRKFINKKSKNWGSKNNPLYGVRPTLPFLMGIWGSAMAVTFGQLYDQIISAMPSSPLRAVLRYALGKTDLKKVRIVWAEIWNFMYKMTGSRFAKYKYLKLADAGIKFGCPTFCTYRRPAEGKKIKEGSAPDVIIILDASSEVGDSELKKQDKYARKHKLPFPEIEYGGLSEKVISIFDKKPDNSPFKDYEIPTVIYLPRVIDRDLLDKYQDTPGLKELVDKINEFDLDDCMKKTCDTFNFKYDKKEFGGVYLPSDQLMATTQFNIQANKEKIKQAMLDRLKLNRERDRKEVSPKRAAEEKATLSLKR
ncbi:hypothetical protein ACFLYA_02520 [Candidatus Dependentiae bacterium]